MKEYPLKSVPVDNPFAFSISITAFDFNPYLSQSPITGSVSMNKHVVLLVTNASPKVERICTISI